MLIYVLYLVFNIYNGKFSTTQPVIRKGNPNTPVTPTSTSRFKLQTSLLCLMFLSGRLSPRPRPHHLICRNVKRYKEIKFLGTQMLHKVGGGDKRREKTTDAKHPPTTSFFQKERE
jgi:hypothetical protein